MNEILIKKYGENFENFRMEHFPFQDPRLEYPTITKQYEYMVEIKSSTNKKLYGQRYGFASKKEAKIYKNLLKYIYKYYIKTATEGKVKMDFNILKCRG